MPTPDIPGKRPPLGCGCATLRRASRAVTQLYDTALRPAGLRPTQFTLLQMLEMVGETRPVELGQYLAMDATTLSRTLKLMEKEGWIASSPGEDRRERLFRVTPRGKEKLARALPRWTKVQQQLRASLGDIDWATWLGLLDRTTAAATEFSL